MANERSRVFAFVLYPDNFEQMRLFDWLKQGYLPVKLLYILHQPESDEKKAHYHVMICFDNQRTPDGVRNFLGISKVVWRLAKMELKSKVKYKLVKDENANTETGYVRLEIWKDVEKYVLRDPEDPQSYIEHEYHDGEKTCPADLKDDEVWRLTPVYVVPHVEKVSDRGSYAAYMLHETPQAIMDGKRRYDRSELKGDRDFLESCFPVKKKECVSNLVSDAIILAKHCKDENDFIRICLKFKRSDIIEYTAQHSYFISKFVLPNLGNKGGGHHV